MKISKKTKEYLINDFKFALNKMGEAKTPDEKLYYFSAIYGGTQRVINIEYDSELAFVHHVTEYAYHAIKGYITNPAQQKVYSIPDNLFSILESYIAELIISIEKGKQTHALLEKISNLAYSTTGNGNYLYRKGLLVP